MPAFVCRWPNGDFTLVQANSKEEATILLDQYGNADGYPLFAIPRLMLDFRLTDDGRLELDSVGEESMDAFWKKLYPKLWAAMSNLEDGQTEDQHRIVVADAVGQERERVPRIPAKDSADISNAMRKQVVRQVRESAEKEAAKKGKLVRFDG